MTPAKIKAARLKAGLTQAQAAELMGVATITWQSWERGINPIPAMAWELFQLKTKPLKCPSCGHKFSLTPKPPKPAPHKGPRERAMKIEIRPGVVLRILDGEATLHKTADIHEGFSAEDERQAAEALKKLKGIKLKG